MNLCLKVGLLTALELEINAQKQVQICNNHSNWFCKPIFYCLVFKCKLLQFRVSAKKHTYKPTFKSTVIKVTIALQRF